MRRRRWWAVPALLCLLVLTSCTRTTIPGLQVRGAPSTGSASVATIPETDTFVRVECWARGEQVSGDPVWYRIGSPQEGWVTNYYVRTSSDFAGAPPC